MESEYVGYIQVLKLLIVQYSKLMISNKVNLNQSCSLVTQLGQSLFFWQGAKFLSLMRNSDNHSA